MLDDENVLRQRDSKGALGVAAAEPDQLGYDAQVVDSEHDGRELRSVVVTGMGGSALAAELVKSWLGSELALPFEIIRTYTLPAYVDEHTLVIASSHSGNTEETIACLEEASQRGAQTAVIATGGVLCEIARERQIARVAFPGDTQPRMAMFYNLRALLALLVHFGLMDTVRYDEVASVKDWLVDQTQSWLPTVTTDANYAKQIALMAAGKTPVFYSGHLSFPVAYKWKISWNENAKNVAFCNQLPEFNHNEFMGWASHPIEKPFAVFDLVSSYEHPRILKRIELTDRLLSGKRPKAQRIELAGDSILRQMLWGCVLADFASIYTAILNGVDPTPVDLIEKFKKELGS